MKTKTITKIEMTEEELFSFNNVFYTLINVRFDNNPTLKNAIEKEWKKNSINMQNLNKNVLTEFIKWDIV